MSKLPIWQVITGYLLAGSIIGPGGLSFVSEMVQVPYNSFRSLSFLLFLFLQNSLTKRWPAYINGGQGLDLYIFL